MQIPLYCRSLIFGNRVGGGLFFFPLLFLERLELAGHHSLITVRADPSLIPFGQTVDMITVLARKLEPLGLFNLLRCFFGYHLLYIGQMSVVVVSDRTDRQTTRTVAKRSDDPQQPLPEAEQFPVCQQFSLYFSWLLNEVPPELKDRGEAEFLSFSRTGALVDTKMTDRIRRT